MFGKTPPEAMVTPPRSLLSSSSFLMARVRWRGTIRLFLLSRAAFPASSRFQRRGIRELLPNRLAHPHPYEWRIFLDGGNVRYDRLEIEDPLLHEAVVDFFSPRPPFPFPFPDIFCGVYKLLRSVELLFMG